MSQDSERGMEEVCRQYCYITGHVYTLTQQPGYSPHKRARTRGYFSDGVDMFHVSCIVEVLPTLLHFSFCLFFDGILVWISNIDHPVFIVVIFRVMPSVVAYICLLLVLLFFPTARTRNAFSGNLVASHQHSTCHLHSSLFGVWCKSPLWELEGAL